MFTYVLSEDSTWPRAAVTVPIEPMLLGATRLSFPRLLLGIGALCTVYTFLAPSTSPSIISLIVTVLNALKQLLDFLCPWHKRPPFNFEFCTYGSDSSRVDVALPDGTGTVRGVKCVYPGLDAFLGVPFAQPPIGDLRFSAPVPLARDPGRHFEASQYGKMCLQGPVRLLSTRYYLWRCRRFVHSFAMLIQRFMLKLTCVLNI